MKRKKIIIIAIVLIAIISAAFVYNYVFNSEHRNIAEEQASAKVASADLFTEFQTDETSATARYLDKVVEITGKVSLVEETGLVLNNAIQVNFIQGTMPEISLQKSIIVKGRCVGYDELLEMVKIDQATVITNTP